jgi:Fe-S cluster assembly iron-binding protein IscA
MVAGLASLDRLVRISVSKSGCVGVSCECQFSLSASDILLVSGPVMTQGPGKVVR